VAKQLALQTHTAKWFAVGIHGLFVIALITAFVAVRPLPVLAVPYGWDTDWGNPERVGTTIRDAPPPVAQAAHDGLLVHWVVRGDASPGEFLLKTTKLPGQVSTTLEAGGKVLGLAACSTAQTQYLAWSAYDGEGYSVTLARLEEDTLSANAVVRRSIPAPVGDLAIDCTAESVIIVAWEQHGVSTPDIAFTAVPPKMVNQFETVPAVKLQELLYEERGEAPGALRSPVVFAGNEQAGLVWFEQVYTQAGRLWYADLRTLTGDGKLRPGALTDPAYSCKPVVELFSPSAAEGPSYRLVSAPDGSAFIVTIGALPKQDYSGLFIVDPSLPGRDLPGQPIPIVELAYQNVYGLSAVFTDEQLLVAWAEASTAPTGSTVRGARVPASMIVPPERLPEDATARISNWTFGRSGAWSPLLVREPSGTVQLLWSELGPPPELFRSQYGAPVDVTRWNLIGATEGDPLGSVAYRIIQLSALATAQTVLNLPVVLLAAAIAYWVSSRFTDLHVTWVLGLAVSIMALALLMQIQVARLEVVPVPCVADRVVHLLVSSVLLVLLGLRHGFTEDFFSLALASTLFLWWNTLFGMIRVVYPS